MKKETIVLNLFRHYTSEEVGEELSKFITKVKPLKIVKGISARVKGDVVNGFNIEYDNNLDLKPFILEKRSEVFKGCSLILAYEKCGNKDCDCGGCYTPTVVSHDSIDKVIGALGLMKAEIGRFKTLKEDAKVSVKKVDKKSTKKVAKK